MTGTPSELADFERVILRDDETLLVRMKPEATPEQTALMAEYLEMLGLAPGRAVIVPPTVESVTQRRETAGRVIITWPRPELRATPPALGNWGVTVHDADTGEQITTILKATVCGLGTDTGWEPDLLAVELVALADENGGILATGDRAVPTEASSAALARWREHGSPEAEMPVFEPRIGVFRYLIAEMRVAEEG